MILKTLTTAIAAAALISTTSFGFAQGKKQDDALNARAQATTSKQVRRGAVAPAPQTMGYGLQTYDVNAPGAAGGNGAGGSVGGGGESAADSSGGGSGATSQ